MIYAITGPPRVGKSTLGQRVANRLQLPYLPTDSLRAAVRSLLPTAQLATQLPIHHARDGAGLKADQLVTVMAAPDFVAAYRTEATTCWPAIASVLEYFSGRHESVVIEGALIRPRTVQAWSAERNVTVRGCVLTRWQAESTTQDLSTYHTDPDWLIDTIEQPATLRHYAERIVALSQSMAAEALAVDWPVISVDDDFEQALADAEIVLCGIPKATD